MFQLHGGRGIHRREKLFTMYDCLSGSDYPCGSQPSLELVAVKSAHGLGTDRDRRDLGRYDVGSVHRARFRSDLLGSATGLGFRNYMILQPEEVVVVQVSDLLGRQADGTWRSPLADLGLPETSAVPPAKSDWQPLTLEVSDVSPSKDPARCSSWS